jgi:Tfp pilus assembly protein PilO
MKSIVPIILVIVSIGVFFAYVSPAYGKIKTLRAEVGQYNEALDNSRELQKLRDGLISKYNTFSPSDVERLEKMLPDTVDNVRLIMDIASIADRYGMSVKNVSVEEETGEESGEIGPDDRPYGSMLLDFSVASTYENFEQFLMDLEESLRVVDVVSLSFRSTNSGTYDYSVSLRTYWLK